MTRDDDGDHPALDGYPVDSDYCDVVKRRADTVSDAEAAERARERFEYEEDGSPSSAEETAQSDAQRPEGDEYGGRTDMSHRFGRYAGSLAGSDYDQEIDEQAPQDHDGRAETRTGFNPREAPSGERDKWRRLNTINDGWPRDSESQNTAAEQRRWAQTFSEALGMTPFQKERVEYVVEGLNMGHMAHYSSTMVVLAIVSLVANEDDRWIRDEEGFRDMMEDVGVTMHEIKRIRLLVRDKSERL